MGWYNYDKIMSYNALFNFILSPRGNGKSYGGKERVIKNFLKKGHQFMYVRRYKDELKDVDKFFDDIKEKFSNVDFKIKGKIALINDEVAGYFVSLSTSQKLKSVPYPNVTTILFDEFIVDKGHLRYLTNEVEVFLDLFETVARKRDNVRAIFLANNVSRVNPYFTYFKCIPKENERFTVAKDGEVVVEMFTDEQFIEEKYKTKFGKLIRNTSYGNYAINNKSLRDNDSFIQKFKPKNSQFLFSIKYKNKEIGFHISYDEGLWYCSTDVIQTSKRRFTITKDDHDINLIMYNSLNSFPMFNDFVKYYKMGYVRFKNIEVKQYVYDILQYMNIK